MKMGKEELNFNIDDEEMEKYAKDQGIGISVPNFLNKKSLENNTDKDIRFRKFDNKERSERHHQNLKELGFFELEKTKNKN